MSIKGCSIARRRTWPVWRCLTQLLSCRLMQTCVHLYQPKSYNLAKTCHVKTKPRAKRKKQKRIKNNSEIMQQNAVKKKTRSVPMHKGTRHMRNSISHCEPTTKVTCLLYAVLPAPLDSTLLYSKRPYSTRFFSMNSTLLSSFLWTKRDTAVSLNFMAALR